MKDTSWARLNDGTMQCAVRQTSRDLFCTGLDSRIFDSSFGVIQAGFENKSYTARSTGRFTGMTPGAQRNAV